MTLKIIKNEQKDINDNGSVQYRTLLYDFEDPENRSDYKLSISMQANSELNLQEETLSSLFDGISVQNTNEKSLGLLSISRQLVQKINGVVECYTFPSEGTEYII